MNSSKKLFLLTQAVVRGTTRNASGSPGTTVYPKFSQLKKTQEHFIGGDNIPIHLKSGQGDRVLALATYAGVFIATLESLRTFYVLAFNKH